MIAYKAHREGKAVVVENSKGEGVSSSTLPEALDFLLANSLEEGEFHVAWDLENFLATILSLLPKSQVSTLLGYWELKSLPNVPTEAQDANRKRLRDEIKGWLAPYGLTYVSERRFRIQKGGWHVVLYHLGQYFPDDTPEPDVKEVAQKGQAILDELKSLRHPVIPFSLSSAGSIITPMLRQLNLPTWKDLPPEVAKAYRFASRKPWIECHTAGRISQAYDFDLVGAYLGVLSNLVDTRFGEWIESVNPPPKALYGIAYGQVSIEANISPLVYIKNTDRFNPRGSWPDWLLLRELRVIEQYKLGKWQSQRGYWFVPNRISRPLNILCGYLFQLRKNPILGLIAKRAGNAVWGLALAEFSTFSEFTNPCWAVETETDVRCRVAEFVYTNKLETHLISVNTDGCLSDCDVPLQQRAYEKPLDWRKDSVGEALAISSGLVWHGRARPNGISLEQALNCVREKPKAYNWKIDAVRPSTPSDLLKEKYTPQKFTRLGFGLPLPSNADRIFRPMPANGADLLNRTFTSTAIEIHQ